MSDKRPINRALVAAQLAKEQKEPSAQPVIVQTNMEEITMPIIQSENDKLDTAVPTSEAVEQTEKNEPKSEQKPESVFLNKPKNTPPTQKFSQKTPLISGLGNDRPVADEPISDPKFTKVDISISGTPHRINCPTGDVMNLNRTADLINEALRDIRRSVRGKSPSNEELLVLHCLDLYDQLREVNSQRDLVLAESQRAEGLLDKILKDIGATGV